MVEERIYTWMPEWKDNERADGGIFYRAFDLVRFIELVEKKTGKKVVGLRFEPDSDNPDKFSANMELIIK